jgi:hypothetical protein
VNLADFIHYLDAHFEPYSEESLLAMAPVLKELGNNKRFLADYVATNLTHPDFQKDNSYRGATFVLGSGRGYMIRAIAWPTETPSGRSPEIYEGRIAHNHTFSLLTLGYWGPGYVTDIYDCPEDAAIGECAPLNAPRRVQLSEGSILYYPAYSVAHTQQPPEAYSVSVNLLAYVSHEREQTFFDVASGKVVRKVRPPSK